MPSEQHHQVVIVGGGTAGITVAARLLNSGVDDVAVIEPSDKHYYQPLWTLVGAGCSTAAQTERDEKSVMPKDATWIKDAATTFEPDANAVLTAGGQRVTYDALVVCPGIQLDWDKIPGLEDALGKDGVSSNYRFDLAPKTWEFIQGLTSGTAVFTMPSGAIKCGGAPQKIAYLACDYWRDQGVLDQIDVHLVLPTPKMFGVPVFSDQLDRVVADYGIEVHFNAELDSLDAGAKKATFRSTTEDGEEFTLSYDVLHAVPHQSAPDWIKSSPLASDTPQGWVDVDKHTMQHVRYPNVFSLGDASSTPNSKTGAAIRKQAPVVVANVQRVLKGGVPNDHYGGYSSCPITTSRHSMLLAEFDYTMEPKPSIPIINTKKPRRDMWLFKKYGLPFLYWNLMLRGRA